MRGKVSPRDLAKKIVREVANETLVSVEEIMGQCHDHHIVLARHLSIRRIAEDIKWGPRRIGRFFKMAHSSIRYALGRFKDRRPPALDRPARTQPRLGPNRSLSEAAERGFTHALMSSGGKPVSVHLSENLARAYLCGSIKKMGCKVIPIKEALAG